MLSTQIQNQWNDYCRIEPKLRGLKRGVLALREFKNENYFEYNSSRAWYVGMPEGEPSIKTQICALVGWDRERDDTLRTSEAYEFVTGYLWRLLPVDCVDEHPDGFPPDLQREFEGWRERCYENDCA